MKILQVNCVYAKGSTGKITEDIHTALTEKGFESVVCYGRGRQTDTAHVYKTSNELFARFNNLKSRFTGLPYSGSFFATNRLIHIIKKEKPDIVHLHCINGFFVNIYRLVRFLKISRIHTVLTLHAEFMYTGSCGHAYACEKWKEGCGHCPMLQEATHSYWLDRTHTSWKKMKVAFHDFEHLLVVSVSPWLQSRAEQSPILSDKRHYTVLNGIDTVHVFHPCSFQFLKEKHHLTNEKIILHVTANFTSAIKGGNYIIDLAHRFKDEAIKIIVIGNTDTTLALPDNIIDVGRVEDQKELAAYYSMADVTVIASKRETFSMVCAESLCCGTPIVGFRAGAPEQIALQAYSEFVEYGALSTLETCIRHWLNKDVNREEVAHAASVYYAKEKMCEEYVKTYHRLSE